MLVWIPSVASSGTRIQMQLTVVCFVIFFEVLELLVDEWNTAPEKEAANKVCVKIQRKEGRLELPPQVNFVKLLSHV